MSEDSLRQKNCPSREELSEYFDKESRIPEEVEAHLKNCETCRNYFEGLTRLDSALKQKVYQETGSDSEISEKILSRVKESLKEEPRPSIRRFFPGPVVWRASVLLLIGCGVGYLLWDEHCQSKKELPGEGIQKSAYVPAAFTAVSDEKEIRFTGNGQGVAINSQVHHEWRIPAKAEALLQELLKNNQIPESSLRKGANGLELTCELSKKQVVRLVEACSNAGFRLLSLEQPQPGNRSFAGNPEEKIRYRAEFIEDQN